MARRRFRSPDQPLPLRGALATVDFCASLELAVVLIALVSIVLAWATFVESRYGTEAVQFGVYGTQWFAGLMGLLGLNILAAALVRLPWKRRHVGFLVTHLGLLILLVGCLFSRQGGIDASLPVFEGNSSHRAFETSQHFALTVMPEANAESRTGDPPPTDGETIEVPFAAGPFNWADYRRLFPFPWRLARRDTGLLYDRDGVQLEVLDYYADSRRVPAPRLELRVLSPEGPRTHGGLGRAWVPLALDVRGSENVHGMQRRYGMGSRDQVGPVRFAFWMTGSEAETAAFRDSQPTGPLGEQGRVVLHAADERFEFAVDQLRQQPRRPLGETGLELEFVDFRAEFLGVQLRIHQADQPPGAVVLFADLPEFNRYDYEQEVFGSYWCEAPADEASQRQGMARNAHRPRIDLLQGADQKLYYRAWADGKLSAIGRLPRDGAEVEAFAGTDQAVTFYVGQFLPMAEPGSVVQPVPFDKNAKNKQRQARVRLTVDGRGEEFWLEGLPADALNNPPPPEGRRAVEGADRRVAITMPRDEVDLGFGVLLRDFTRKLDPGTSQASHYSSLVDFIDRHDENRRLAREVLISMNAPVDFSDPASGRSYRLFQASFGGPWKPGDPLFHEVVDRGSDRDQLYLSWLTVNYDPGRGLKYAGSLLICVGIAMVFYSKGRRLRGSREGMPSPTTETA